MPSQLQTYAGARLLPLARSEIRHRRKGIDPMPLDLQGELALGRESFLASPEIPL